MNRTSKLAYTRHKYSGPRKSRKKVQATLKRHHGSCSDINRAEAWRKKQKLVEETADSPVVFSPHITTTQEHHQLSNLTSAQDTPKIRPKSGCFEETKKKPVNEEIVIDTSKITPKPQLRTYARVRKALSQESTYSACSTITVTHEPVVEPLQKQQNEERKETTEGRTRSHLRDSILETSEKPHLTTEIEMETGALNAGFQEAMELDWTSEDSCQETAPSSDEVNIFCPRCNTEVPHTAEGIQEDKIKILVTRVFYYFEQEYEDLKSTYGDLDLTPFSMLHQRTAMATGVSETTLMQILKEEERRDEERQRELLQEGPARKRRRQNDRVQTLEVKTEPPEFSYEEPEIMLPLGVQLEPGVGEIDTAQLHLDPLAVEVKTELREDELATAQLQMDPIAEEVKTELRDNELATTQHQEHKSCELSVPVASSSVTYTETLHGMNQRSKHLVLLALSDGNKNSIEVQNLANSTKLPYSKPENALSLTNSECPVSPSNLEDPTTTTPEQDDTTFENPGNSPSILFATNKSYEQEGIDFQTGDFSGTDSGDKYRPGPRSRSLSSSSSSSSTSSSSDSPADNNNSNNESPAEPITKPRGKKRTRNPTIWKKNVAKQLKNSGQTYISVKTKKLNPSKTIGPTCTIKCRLSCAAKFTEQKRTEIFKSYWKLESLARQRGFLNACTRPLKCAYRRVKTDKRYDRKANTAYYLLNENKEIRVCKTFLINTLGITQRILRTVIDGKAQSDGFIPPDQRGKHGKQCTLEPEVIKAVKDHIESIPRVESHYLRDSTSRQFIDGGLTVAELHRNYSEIQKQQNKPIVNYDAYSRIFNRNFNIGFFKPKKDRCDECEAYENVSEEEKK